MGDAPDRDRMLEYEPGSRRQGFWTGVPLVVKVFLAVAFALALTRAVWWAVFLIWGQGAGG